MSIREMTYLVTARTTAVEGVPVFWTCLREQAMSKAHNLNHGCVNDAGAAALLAGRDVDSTWRSSSYRRLSVAHDADHAA